MLSPEQIRDRLADRNVQAVSRKTGVSANAIYRLMADESQPLFKTVKALSDYLEGPAEADDQGE